MGSQKIKVSVQSVIIVVTSQQLLIWAFFVHSRAKKSLLTTWPQESMVVVYIATTPCRRICQEEQRKVVKIGVYIVLSTTALHNDRVSRCGAGASDVMESLALKTSAFTFCYPSPFSFAKQSMKIFSSFWRIFPRHLDLEQCWGPQSQDIFIILDPNLFQAQEILSVISQKSFTTGKFVYSVGQRRAVF